MQRVAKRIVLKLLVAGTYTRRVGKARLGSRPPKKSGRGKSASLGPNFQIGKSTRVGDVLEVALRPISLCNDGMLQRASIDLGQSSSGAKQMATAVQLNLHHAVRLKAPGGVESGLWDRPRRPAQLAPRLVRGNRAALP